MRKKFQTKRFISLYITDTPTEYDYFFNEDKEKKKKPGAKNSIKNDAN